MQSKTAQEFKTVYEHKGFNFHSGLDVAEQMAITIYESLHRHYAMGDLLRVDSRIHMIGMPCIAVRNAHVETIFDVVEKFCQLDQITKIEMRLNAGELDRWIAVPKSQELIRLHVDDALGFRRAKGTQTEVAVLHAINLQGWHTSEKGTITHIYIPSTDSREIPIYPCEPYTPKKADPKSWSQMLSVDPEAEVQSQPGKVDFKPFGGIVPQADKSAETFVVVTPPFVVRNSRVEESIERLWAKIGMKLPMTMRSDMLTVGRWLKEEGFTCQEWVDYIRSVKRPDSLGEPVREKAQREWESFPNPTAETIRVVSTDPARKHPLDELVEPWDAAAERNAKRKPVTITLPTDPIEDSAMQFAADGKVYHSTTEQLATLVTEAMKKPELREAVFKKLASDLDRETLIAIWAEMDKE